MRIHQVYKMRIAHCALPKLMEVIIIDVLPDRMEAR
jgi:hypothetical protein